MKKQHHAVEKTETGYRTVATFSDFDNASEWAKDRGYQVVPADEVEWLMKEQGLPLEKAVDHAAQQLFDSMPNAPIY